MEDWAAKGWLGRSWRTGPTGLDLQQRNNGLVPRCGMGPSRVGLDRCRAGFGLFWLEQTRMVATDPTGRVDRPDWRKSGRTSPRRLPMEF
ncbi:hypothetical protein CRG98_007594 [Punica granatum]|uniref:Uncharacterized protein n=1 Tax=Punica granatum TaxID=22663 RepID=A0A2I0KUA3_PUNGR|nr:hypothetical protein CRG98_007594 [Punica granatum]